MGEASTLWAIGLDYGSEGKQPPVTLFRTREQAEAAMALLSALYSNSIYCVEVPIWPGVREAQS